MTPLPRPQLKMVLSPQALQATPWFQVPPGYQLRQCLSGDAPSFRQLMSQCQWDFGDDRMAYCHSRLLPGGWFVVTARDSPQVVASAMSLHNYSGRSIYSGTLGWVGCLPEHRGRGLGRVVAAAATTRLVQAGYTDVELYTEYFRADAIEIYFRLGFLPYLYNDAVTEVWRDVCQAIGRPFTPQQWPFGNNAWPAS